METQPKKQKKSEAIAQPIAQPIATKSNKELVVELITSIEMIAKGNREIDLAVEALLKTLEQAKSLITFIEKAEKEDKKNKK